MATSERPTDPAAAFAGLESPLPLSDAAIDARARSLLADLSLDEKLGLMDGDAPFWAGLTAMAAPRGYSSQVWVAGAVPRLGIPGIRFSDGPRGIVLEGATTFPVTMARGATFDTELEERVGDVIGRELRAHGGNFFGGVCINLLRHPAWGRAQETYGEDTFHLGMMGAALATGVQRHAMACVKHFALNSMENARQGLDVKADARTLHEVYLPHFKRVVDAGVAALMTSYNSVNGEWAGQNKVLIQDILKDMWGFGGFVIADFINGMRDAKKAVLAGQDIEMPFELLYHRDLRGLVERGEVPMARIDDACLRILRQEVRLAAGGDPNRYPHAAIGAEAHRMVAREVAEKSIVLLKNEGELLPLKGGERILVVGKLAAIANTGDGGSSNTRPAYVVTPLDGMRAAFGNVDYDDGSDPAAAARRAENADVVLVVAGYTHADEGEFIPPDQLGPFKHNFPKPANPEEQATADRILNVMGGPGAFSPGGDRLRLSLTPADEALIRTVAAANRKTVVAIMAGSAVITEAWRHDVPAILVLWYPGMEGGNGLANVLSGKVNPSGRLPCIFPANDGQLPFFDRDATEITYDLWHGYRKLERDGNKAAFPFGFGLSYTRFAYANLKLAKPVVAADGVVAATVDVTNTGRVAGAEVVQLYVGARGSAVERAPRELKAFARIELAPGETRTVRLLVPVPELAWFDEGRGWIVERIEYEAIVGRNAADESALRASFRVA